MASIWARMLVDFVKQIAYNVHNIDEKEKTMKKRGWRNLFRVSICGVITLSTWLLTRLLLSFVGLQVELTGNTYFDLSLRILIGGTLGALFYSALFAHVDSDDSE